MRVLTSPAIEQSDLAQRLIYDFEHFVEGSPRVAAAQSTHNEFVASHAVRPQPFDTDDEERADAYVRREGHLRAHR